MAENKSRWNWDVSGFEPRKTPSSSSPSSTSPLDHLEDQRPAVAPLVRRYSISATSVSPHSPEMSKQALATKLQRLKDKVKVAKEDYLALRQEASDLQEYSNAKLDRVTRYLGVLAEKTCKLDQVAIETEARISPLINEKKRLFNDLLTSKGNIKVFCRTRPLFEDEGHSVIEFPDDCTIRVNTGDDSISNPKKDFEFDRVYGPHVGQAELFSDVQPLVQSALDGYNVSIFAYGQTHSGKTHTMEGSSHDRGLYSRCFEELFDLSNLDSTSTSRYKFSVTVFELYNEQIRDLLSESGGSLAMIRLGTAESFIKVVQEKVDNPLEFSKVLKSAFQSRGNDVLKFNVSHLIIMIHIYYNNLITGESTYSKLSLVDLAGSEGLITEDDSGERVTDLLHVMKSLSALGDVLSSLSSRKDIVPYENSMLTKVLADSLGGNSKTLMIVNVCPNSVNLSETLASLNFSARARNAVLSLGNRDTIKKWRDVANDTRKELYEREKEIQDHKQEIVGLRQSLKEANDQCILLYNEVQKAWKVSFTLQSDLKSENYMLSEKHKIEKEQNAQLRNQVARLLQLEQEQKMQIQERDYTIQTLQAKIKKIESQLNEALHSREVGLTPGSAPGSAPGPAVSSISKATEDGMDSSAVTKKLEEELKKRDALIERLHEENEKLFDRLTEKASVVGSPQVSSPLSKGLVNVHSRKEERVQICRQRKKLMKQLLGLRKEFADSQLAYLRSLKNTGVTLRQFTESESLEIENPPYDTTLEASPPPSLPPSPPPPPPPYSPDLRNVDDNLKDEVIHKESIEINEDGSRISPTQVLSPSWEYHFHYSSSHGQSSKCEMVTQFDEETWAETKTDFEEDDQEEEVNSNTVTEKPPPEELIADNLKMMSSYTKDTTHMTMALWRRKTLDGIIKELDDYFLKAWAAGKDIGILMDIKHGDTFLPQNFKENKRKRSNSPKVFSSLSWNWSSKPLQFTQGAFGMCGPSEPCRPGAHCITLSKLYAAEQRLYKELKEEETTKLEHKKKSMLLQKQEDENYNWIKTEKTRVCVEKLGTDIRRLQHSISETCSSILQIIEEELYPQLVALISGLMHMWRTMYECHQVQKHISERLSHLTDDQSKDYTTESHQQATAQLEVEVTAWLASFCKLTNSQRVYVRTLCRWIQLTACLVHDQQTYSSSAIRRLCEHWQLVFDKLPDKVAIEAISSFLSAIQVIFQQQLEERNLHKKSDRLEKRLQKELKSLAEMEKKLEGTLPDGVDPSNLSPKHPLSLKSAKIEALRKQVHTEETKYLNSVQVTRDMIMNNLKTSLPIVFEALMGFSSDSARAFEAVHCRINQATCSDASETLTF